MNISVVIPTYKRPDLLARLLKSISLQTLLPNEVIVIDDCSGMESEYSAVIKEFDSIFEKLIFESLKQNSGAPTARNLGISKAKGDWVALVDDDDEWLPSKLEKQAELINKSNDPQLGFVYTWTEAKGQAGQESYTSKVSHKGDSVSALLNTNYIMSASVLIKRQALQDVSGFKESLPSCQDWDTWIRIALAGYHFDLVEEVLTIYHRHGGESIGLSPKAKLGYKLLLEAFWLKIITKTSPINWLKKALLYIKVVREIKNG
ncbi:glycosyltransferase family A protein [Pseudoalteromonas sp. BZB3]|uniref:glycosyltransferase family 2 protein n=1 Tax=Pseudoalteromonas sp. BZB3 TaxID=3136670 RepID=UPI0032C499E2